VKLSLIAVGKETCGAFLYLPLWICHWLCHSFDFVVRSRVSAAMHI